MNLQKIILRSLIITLASILVILSAAAVTVYFFQDKIIQVTVAQLNRYLITKIEVNPKIEVSFFENFPHLSVKFKDVKIYEHPSAGSAQLASAEKLSFAFDFYNLINSKYLIDEVTMENGFVKIKIDALGKVNYNIIKTDSTVNNANPLSFNLQQIKLTNVSLTYHNITGNQYHEILLKNAKAKLSAVADMYAIDLQTTATVINIQVANRKFFQNKDIETSLAFNLNTVTGIITIDPTEVEVEKALFKIAGKMSYKKPRHIDLKIEETEGSIHTLLSLLPEDFGKELKAYQSEGQVFLTAKIKGEFRNNQNPLIEANFGFRNATFYHPDLKKKITQANLNGYFTNGHRRQAITSALRLEQISCMMEGQPLKGNMLMSNFADPYLKCNIHGLIDVRFLYDFYPIKEISQVTGSIDINAKFSGRIADLKSYKTSANVTAEGEITLVNIGFKHQRLPYKIEGLNAEILFSNNDVSISSLRGTAGSSDFLLNGFMKNAVGNMIFHTSSMYIEADLKANKINMNELLNFANIATPSKVNITKNSTGKVTKNRLDNILCKINCDIKQLTYNKLNCKNITGELTYQANEIYLNDTKITCAGGQVRTSGNIIFRNNKTIEARTISELHNINIDSLFYVCEDFGQTFITQKNLKGELGGTIDALFEIDKNYSIVPATAIANIEVQLLNGELINFEPLKRLSKFVAETKLAHIQFSELTNKIFIEEGTVHIPEMTIKSNVSEMSISGTHTFTQEMDYRLTLPLKNLSPAKRDSDEAFGAIAPDKRGDPKLFITIKGNADNYKIAYDKQRTQQKIKEELKKEKQEFLQIFKKKEQSMKKEEKTVAEPAFFDFGD